MSGAFTSWARGTKIPNWLALLIAIMSPTAVVMAAIIGSNHGSPESVSKLSLEITSPDPTSANQSITGPVVLKGHATGLDAGDLIWPFDNGVAGSQVWPHLGPCPVKDNGDWVCPAFTLGQNSDAGRPFTLYVSVVSPAEVEVIVEHIVNEGAQPTPLGGSTPPGRESQQVVVIKGGEASTPTDAPPSATIDPGPASIVRGSDLGLSGTASNLGSAALWLVEKHEKDQDYYVTENTPIAVQGGRWGYTDTGIGDASDVGSNIDFVLYASSDTSCADFFHNAPSDGDTPVPAIPQSCGNPLATLVMPIK